MLLQTIGAVFGFLLFVAPGLTYQLLRERRRPPIENTPFREAMQVALSSLVFSGAALALLVVVRAAQPGWLPDPGRWLAEGSRYVTETDPVHYRLIARSLTVEVLLACGLAGGWFFLSQRDLGARNVPDPVLWTALHRSTEKPSVPRAAIKLKDGATYVGDVAVVGYGSDDEHIVLAPPFDLERPRTGQVEVPGDWQRIVLPVGEIAEMWLMFNDPPSAT